jgi:seipin
MYNYRVLSFLAFTSTFWSVSMTSATIAWVLVSAYLSPPSSPEPKKEEPEPNGHTNGHHANGTVKTEEEDSPIDVFSTESLSDSQRTFPSFGRQMPLRFPLREREIKRESESTERERGGGMEALAGQTGAGEADDEDEDEKDEGAGDGGRTRRSDSGIGTSMEEGAEERRRGVQRRSRLFGGGDGAED